MVTLGYDLLFLLKRGAPPNDVIIIYQGDKSFNRLNQTGADTWDRDLHAQLLDKLTADAPRVVVFDIIFDTTNGPTKDANFSRAIRRNGKVVLAAGQVEGPRNQHLKGSATRPIDLFLDSAAGWGIAGYYKPLRQGDIARQYFVGDAIKPSLSWAAAKVANAPITRASDADQPEDWLNYYGPALTLPWIEYADALEKEPGFFRNKCVFIGARPKTLRALEEADAFPTPYSLWRGNLFPGVEIGATAFLNLLRNDGMKKMPLNYQALIVAGIGLIFGALLALLRPLPAIGVAMIGVMGLMAFSADLGNRHIWFAWPIAGLVQIPLALGWALRGRFIRLKFEKDVLTRTLEETTRLVEATKLTAHKSAQLVPDHDLVRLVGKGAYGEVWLARNAVGVFHAVKIVRRAAFPSDVPYDREFRGIQKFMPVSRSHPGFIHLLHVGRNDTERCFYCIMEVGDDQTTGQRIDPETYTPKSLASELKWRGRLAPEESLRIGLALSLALEHLHQHGLIHRDIKPGNIIYVDNQPKFADIGLVTDIAGEGRDVSFLGTQGYIPPEGPGSPAADVYALGKLLYEAAMGRDREFFPELPTAVYEASDDSLLRQLQKVIFKACESETIDRYRSAAELHTALLEMHRSWKQREGETRSD